MPVIDSPFLKDIIKGWNEKLEFNNIDLTNLVPFVQLFALYDTRPDQTGSFGNDEARFRNNEPIIEHLKDPTKGRLDDIINVVVTDQNKAGSDASKRYYYTGVEIAKLESQIQSNNFKGGVGIESLKVNRGTRESFLSKYDLDVVVTDTNIFKDQIEYTSMYGLNQTFLILHGWTSKSMGTFKKPPRVDDSNTLNVDLNDNHKGYWTTSVVSLQKFRFSLDQQSHLRCNLTFLSSVLSNLMFKRTVEFAKNVLRDLQSPIFSSDAVVDGDDIDRIRLAAFAKEGRGVPEDALSFNYAVYVAGGANSIRVANNTLNNLKRLIELEIKEEVEFDESKLGRGTDGTRNEWKKVFDSSKFKKAKDNFTNNNSIDFRRVEYFITGPETAFPPADGRLNLSIHQQTSRARYFNAVTSQFPTGNRPRATIITLSQLREILTTDEELNSQTIYGGDLGSSILEDESFRENNPIYDADATEAVGLEAVPFPRGATINTRVVTTKIRELSPPLPPLEDGRFGTNNRTRVQLEGSAFGTEMWFSNSLVAGDTEDAEVYFRRAGDLGYVVVTSLGTILPASGGRDIQYTDEFGNISFATSEEGRRIDTQNKFHDYVQQGSLISTGWLPRP
jgi:hypothetical protein